MLALRLSQDEKRFLDALVQRRAERLASEGGTVTASSVIRALIRQAAEQEKISLDAAERPARKTPKP